MYYQNTRTIKTTLSAALILAAGSIAGVATAQVDGSIIQPTGASTSYIELFGPAVGAGNLIDQSGLSGTYTSGTTDFDSYVTSTTHDGGASVFLICNSNGQNQPNGIVDLGETITLDLGSAFAVDALAMWNTDSASDAITAFDLYADSDNDFTNGTTALLGSYAPSATITGQSFSFPATQTQFVHIVVTGHGGGDFIRVGEFAFRYAAPAQVSNTTQGTQHLTLQDALDNAISGDAITIDAGTLFEDNIVFPTGLDVTITGAGMDQTFIDGGNDDNDLVFNFIGDSNQTAATVIQNLSITNVGVGGAMRIREGATPTIRSVRFLNCSGASALDVVDSALIDRCVFTGTTNTFATVFADAGSATFLQCLIADNSTIVGVQATGSSQLMIVNSTIRDATFESLKVNSGAQVTVTNSVLQTVVVEGAFSPSHSLYAGAPAGNGNIDGSPTFVDAANGDYRLAPSSLGIDAADYDAYITAAGGAFDLSGAWRRIDGAPADTGVGAFTYLDIGAYETETLVADCNNNGIEDSVDLATKGAFTDLGSPDGHAFTLNSNAATNPVVDNGSIRLTEGGVQGQLASAIFDPNLASPVGDFRASFDFRFGPGTFEGADGISFAVLDKNVYDTTAIFNEFGPGNDSLVVRIQDFATQTISVVHNGTVLASVASPVDLDNQQWHHIEVETLNGVVTVTMTPWAGQPMQLISVATSFTSFEALYGFGSRTGAVTNEHRIDNIRFESLLSNDANNNGTPDDCDPPCLADVNGDGMVTPTDFTAWINAFNNNLPECDQNGDGNCTPADFTAWIANFNAGCS